MGDSDIAFLPFDRQFRLRQVGREFFHNEFPAGVDLPLAAAYTVDVTAAEQPDQQALTFGGPGHAADIVDILRGLSKVIRMDHPGPPGVWMNDDDSDACRNAVGEDIAVSGQLAPFIHPDFHGLDLCHAVGSRICWGGPSAGLGDRNRHRCSPRLWHGLYLALRAWSVCPAARRAWTQAFSAHLHLVARQIPQMRSPIVGNMRQVSQIRRPRLIQLPKRSPCSATRLRSSVR